METTFIREEDAWKGKVNNYNQRGDSSMTDESPLERHDGMDGD
jgi:hypothetical protein